MLSSYSRCYQFSECIPFRYSSNGYLETEKVTEQDPNKKAHSIEHDNLFVDQKLF